MAGWTAKVGRSGPISPTSMPPAPTCSNVKPNAPFDPPQQYAREQAIFGAKTPFYGWHYPPYFLFVAAALAKLPYGLALAVWQATTFAFYLLAIWAIVASSFRDPRSGNPKSIATAIAGLAPETSHSGRRLWIPDSRSAASGMTADWLLLALAFPAVLINIGHGQNGFLTAALLGGALVLLERRPILAGILFGLLIYKPQFGLLIPIALAAGRRWRSFAAAAATVAALTAVTTAAFGPEVWHAFLLSTKFSRSVVLEHGDTGWYKIQSVFSWARMWGASIALAYALQATVTIAVGGAIVRVWRSAASPAQKSASLCLATILATPYTLDYDMMVLAPAIAFFAVDGLKRGFRAWEKSALAALWLMPLLARTFAHATLIPLGVPAMLTAFVLLMRRAELDRRLPMASTGASATMASATSGTGGTGGHDIAAFE